jgi:alanine transaminase
MSDVNGNDLKHKKHEKFLTMSNLNKAVKNVQYAVRGPVVIRAAEIEKELKKVFIFSTL